LALILPLVLLAFCVLCAHGAGARDAVLRGLALFGVSATAITELLSLFHLLKPGPVFLSVGRARREGRQPPCCQSGSPKCDGAFDHLMGAGKHRSRKRRVKGIILLVMPEPQKTLAARHDGIARSRLSALLGRCSSRGRMTSYGSGADLWKGTKR
jgi:hypothetical protein